MLQKTEQSFELNQAVSANVLMLETWALALLTEIETAKGNQTAEYLDSELDGILLHATLVQHRAEMLRKSISKRSEA